MGSSGLYLLCLYFFLSNILAFSVCRKRFSLSVTVPRIIQKFQTKKMASLIDGNAVAGQIRTELKGKVEEIKEMYGITPGLAVILVGGRTDSATYVRSKKKACAEVGIESYGFDYPLEVSEEELLAKIHELNAGTNLLRSKSFCL
jgi:hypothetical protein